MAGAEPLVTVGIAVYGGERYIAEAITSVLQETYQNWELLLVNDCSPDDSVGVIRTFTDSRIRLVENERNLGLVGVRNRILKEARGQYIAWLDQDDLTLPDRLRTEIEFLEAHPQVAACGSWTQMLTEGVDGAWTTGVLRLPSSAQDIRASMAFLNPLACNTVTMRRSIFFDRGLTFREEFGNSLDYDLWSRASDVCELNNVAHPLATYRVHAGQTSQGAALERMHQHALRIQAELLARALSIDMTPEQVRLHRLATIEPELISTDDLDRIAGWFTRLRNSNQERGGFDSRAWDAALTRQWITACRGAWTTSGSAALGTALSGTRRIGLGVGAILSGIRDGAARRRARASA